MISTHDTLATLAPDRTSVWARLASPLPSGVIAWRQDGKPIARDGRFIARFVAYIEANTVRERLDTVVPGEWDLTLDLLPPLPTGADDPSEGIACSFKARLQVLGVIREDVGTGRDYKQAATDAFKRAAVRFGIGHELYAYEQNWVTMDGDGRYAKPLEDPQGSYARRHGSRANGAKSAPVSTVSARDPSRLLATAESSGSSLNPTGGAAESEIPVCPKCGGRVWDNRLTKRNPRAPDFKCRDRSCEGVIWPSRPHAVGESDPVPAGAVASIGGDALAVGAAPLAGEDIPF